MKKDLTKRHLDQLTYKVVGAAIEVHKELGPGLLESVYHRCLCHELQLRNVHFRSELAMPIEYKGLEVDVTLRCDFFVGDSLVVELKTVESVLPVHEAQLLTYMKLLKVPKGILINFNVANLFKEGQKTYVNELFRTLPE
ncbi:GxxExxY protein [Echinicola strongylocentroti]|uniref:GxxExxY protein n=1 Tax=Echinicola strongylocentroti TaxID=1795355 RepID=A0A2Z4IFJ7_9BACT|nr:GxxExxY protein [Echinicola strongylocentroti]AWW29268.1 GxxExxY protein [Echinicola strongylocentroti]